MFLPIITMKHTLGYKNFVGVVILHCEVDSGEPQLLKTVFLIRVQVIYLFISAVRLGLGNAIKNL